MNYELKHFALSTFSMYNAKQVGFYPGLLFMSRKSEELKTAYDKEARNVVVSPIVNRYSFKFSHDNKTIDYVIRCWVQNYGSRSTLQYIYIVIYIQ